MPGGRFVCSCQVIMPPVLIIAPAVNKEIQMVVSVVGSEWRTPVWLSAVESRARERCSAVLPLKSECVMRDACLS